MGELDKKAKDTEKRRNQSVVMTVCMRIRCDGPYLLKQEGYKFRASPSCILRLCVCEFKYL